jgi:ABC-type sugar transport system substrate-binding protein
MWRTHTALITAVAVVLVAGSLACSAGSSRIRIAVMFPGSVRYFQVSFDAMQRAADRRGFEIVRFDAGWSAATQVSQLQLAAGGNFDVVAIAAVDSRTLAAATSVIGKRNVPLVTFTNGVGEDPKGSFEGVTSFVGRDEFQSGLLLAEQVAALERPDTRVVVIEGAPGTSPQRFRSSGFDATAVHWPEWKILAREQIDGWRLDLVESTIARLAQSQRFNVVVTQWAEAAVVVDRYLTSIGWTDYSVVSLEWTNQLVRQMDNGHIRSSTYSSVVGEAESLFEVVAKVVAGKRVPRFVETPQQIITAKAKASETPEW